MADDQFDEDAFRERLAAMSTTDIAALYFATVEDWAALGIDLATFTGNMKALDEFNEAVRPLELVHEAYLDLADDPSLREARLTYLAELQQLYSPANSGRPYADIQADAQALRLAYDDTIAACSDPRVIESKRLYDEVAVSASEAYARRLR